MNWVLLDLLLTLSPAALYSFSLLLGHSVQRRKRERLPEARLSDLPPRSAPPVGGWTPRQQALVSLAGTIISALIGLFGTILTVLANT
jgi:hypothetical protein